MDVIYIKSSSLINGYETIAENCVVFVMPYIDSKQANSAVDILLGRSGFSDFCVVAVEDDSRVGFIKVANTVYTRTRSIFYGYVASDVFPSRHWLEMSVRTFSNSDIGLLSFNDGKWFGKLASFGMLRRSWVETIYKTGMFHSGYVSHYADTELSVIAIALGQLGYDPNIVMMEIDYDKDRKNVLPADKELYLRRVDNFKKSKVTWKISSAFDLFS